MTDTFSKNERSAIMRAVKPSGNQSTELKLIEIFKYFSVKGWRRNYPLIGKSDFVFRKLRLALFVDGCFWHGHNCRNTNPKDNAKYWTTKFAKNRARDLSVTRIVENKGWTVIRIWECELKKSEMPAKLTEVISTLTQKIAT